MLSCPVKMSGVFVLSCLQCNVPLTVFGRFASPPVVLITANPVAVNFMCSVSVSATSRHHRTVACGARTRVRVLAIDATERNRT